MLKRTISVLLAVLLMFAAAAVAYADGDTPAQQEPAKKPVIYFNAESVGWEEAKYVGFHIWELGGKPFSDWGGKAERGTLCKEYNEHGEEIDIPCFIWQFDFAAKGITLEEGKQYGVIFYNDRGGQTYNLLFDTTCFEDTADCDTTNVYENPEDSDKIAYPAYWRHQNPEVNGPELKITSIGNVVGVCLPRGVTKIDLLRDFAGTTLNNVRTFTDLTDQEIFDGIGAKLGMNRDEVEEAISSVEMPIDWDKGASTLPEGQPIGHSDDPIYFDASSAGWDDSEYIGFHIWSEDDEDFTGLEWGAKQQRGTLSGDAGGTCIWEYDPAAHGLELKDGKQYVVVFYNDQGGQTYDLLFDKTCLGDTAFCGDEEILENPVDSDKTTRVVYWKNQDPNVNGPELKITSIGTVVGMCVPRKSTAAGILKDFLINRLENAREYSGLSDHQLIENIAKDMQLTVEDVEEAIADSGVIVNWNSAKSSLAHREPAPGAPDRVDYTVEVAEGEGTAFGDKEYLTINYSLPPEYQYDAVTLTATPAEGYRFVGWEIEGEYVIEGDATLESEVLAVKAHDGIAAHAYFEPVNPKPPIDGGSKEYPVSVDVIAGEGTAIADKSTVTVTQGVAPWYYFDTLTLTATPAEGYRFVCWEIEATVNNSTEQEDIFIQNPVLKSSEVTIRVCSGVSAHARFAPIIRGDYDGDGEVTILDATRAQRIIAELDERPSEALLAQIDADGDGELTILDATRIQRVIAELCYWDGSPVIVEDPTEPDKTIPGDELPFVPA